MGNLITIDGIIKKAKIFLPDLNEERVRLAYDFASKAHEGQVRFSGEPYIRHPLEVVDILLSLKPDEDSIIAGLLHDVLEDTPTDAEDVRKLFGNEVIPLLKGLEKLSKVHYRGVERQVENLRKMFLAMAKDLRVILIKLADRLHNMRTLDHLNRADKIKRIAEETLSVYSPIAARLGIYRIKNELDTLCFSYLYPDEYKRLTKELKEITGNQNQTIKNSKSALQKVLKKAGIEAKIDGRLKNPYSVFKKLKRKDKNYVSEIYDVFALRIVVKDEAECYQVLGLIHKHWTPLTRRFKDYIAVRKSNGYQSLHTTLIGLCRDLNNQPIEVQIRTTNMNEIAEYGVAAHWHYKENEKSEPANEQRLQWVQTLVELHENLKSNSEFIESLSVDIFHDRIFVLTPKGDVHDLPYGATPIDFAYAIHTDVGHRCRGAKVNNMIVPLDYKLKNGQVVEILTGNAEQPNRYWLSIATTSLAKSRIKQWFNMQDGEKILKIGKDLINKKLKQLNQAQLDPNLSIFKVYEGEKMSIRERENLVERIGNGSLNAIDVLKKVISVEHVMKERSTKEIAKEVLSEGVNFEEKKPEILITGEKGHKTMIASCCHPTPEDPIIGYITRGRGVTIHKKNCKVLNGLEKDRLIKTSWSSKRVPKYTAKLRIERRSRLGLLRDVAEVFVVNQLAIMDIQNVRDENSDQGHFIMTVSLDSFETLDSLIQQLTNVDGVFSVKEID